MKKLSKRIITLFLGIFMLFTVIPFTASAANYSTDYTKYSAPTRVLKYTSGNATCKGNDVKWFQCAINYLITYGDKNGKKLSATKLNVDGNYGPASKKATTAFQKKYGLTQDGSFGTASRNKMKDVLDLNSIKYWEHTEPTRTLKYTSSAVLKGDDVKWFQCAINYLIDKGDKKGSKLNTTKLDVDGSFGPASKTALLAFQKKYGLTQNGSFNTTARKKMNDVLKVVHTHKMQFRPGKVTVDACCTTCSFEDKDIGYTVFLNYLNKPDDQEAIDAYTDYMSNPDSKLTMSDIVLLKRLYDAKKEIDDKLNANNQKEIMDYYNNTYKSIKNNDNYISNDFKLHVADSAIQSKISQISDSVEKGINLINYVSLVNEGYNAFCSNHLDTEQIEKVFDFARDAFDAVPGGIIYYDAFNNFKEYTLKVAELVLNRNEQLYWTWFSPDYQYNDSQPIFEINKKKVPWDQLTTDMIYFNEDTIKDQCKKLVDGKKENGKEVSGQKIFNWLCKSRIAYEISLYNNPNKRYWSFMADIYN